MSLELKTESNSSKPQKRKKETIEKIVANSAT
jgi:hypothetical protein